MFKTRKLISRFIKISKIKTRPENIPSNINRSQDSPELPHPSEEPTMKYIETITSEEEVPVPNSLEFINNMLIDYITDIPCLENMKLNQIEEVLERQKATIAHKHAQETSKVEKMLKDKKIDTHEYEETISNINKFHHVRLAQIHQSISNVRRLSSHTGSLLSELKANRIPNSSPLRCHTEDN